MSSIWIIFAFLTAIIASASSLVEKKILFKQHALEFATTLAFYNLLLTIPLWFFSDFKSTPLEAIGLIYLASVLASIAFLLITKSIRHIAISITSPFLVLEPMFVALLAVIILRESITLLQGAGMLIIIIGAYTLSSHEHDHFFEPFKHVFKSKYIRYILVALIIYSFTSILDKKVVGTAEGGGLGVPVLSYMALVHFFIAINFILINIILGHGAGALSKGVKNGGWAILAIAVLTISYRLTYTYAISLPGVLVSLVVPIKRLSALFCTIIGGELFHEHHILRKSLACVIMIIGAIFILI